MYKIKRKILYTIKRIFYITRKKKNIRGILGEYFILQKKYFI